MPKPDKSKIPRATRRRNTRGYSGVSIGADITEDKLEFLRAIDAYKRESDRPFLSWTEVLRIVHALGYRKVAAPKPTERTKGDCDGTA